MKNLNISKFLLVNCFLFVAISFNSQFYADNNNKLHLMKPDGIIIHSSSCPGLKNIFNSGSDVRQKNYHFFVARDGNIYVERQENEIIYHIGHDLDHRSLSVVVEGSFGDGRYRLDNENPAVMPDQQRKSLETLIFRMMKKYDIPLSQVERHMDHDLDSDCPGYDFRYFYILYSMAKTMIKNSGKNTLEQICNQRGIRLPLENAKLEVIKSSYVLKLYSGKNLLKTYEIGLSNKPVGDKLRKGDRRTPVGEFYICEKYPMRAWMEINYPDAKHANIAIKRKIITKDQYRSIIARAKSGGIPWHKSPLGNDIGFHAGGFPYGRMRRDYTAGCIGLQDPEAFEIYFAVPLGSKVVIKE